MKQKTLSVSFFEALKNGSSKIKLSMLIFGFANMAYGQIAKGIMFLAVELAYIFFMLRYGLHNLSMLVGLGSVEQKEVWDEAKQVY